MSEIKQILEADGYFKIIEIEGRGLCGLYIFIFTTGLCYGLNKESYAGRYCFSNTDDAAESLREWDGIGDPPGYWIKHKGKIEYSNTKNL